MVTPAYSDAQRIGTLGKRFFIGNHPDTWQQESEPEQGGDFGFDVSMWLTQLGKVLGRFAVQLKATTVSDIQGAGKKFTSVPLSRETCNLYLQDGQPVMLVLVALEDGYSAQSATMYYDWIDAQIQRRLDKRAKFDESDPAQMSFRIPIKNELTPDVDISGYLKQYWTHTRLANSLRSESGTAALGTVSGLSPEAVAGLGHRSIQSLNRWLVHDALEGDCLWATPKPGSDAAKIKQIADYITHGNRQAADRLIAEIDLTSVLEPDVRSELLFQLGRRESLQGNVLEAYDRFQEASALLPDSCRYFVAELESAVVSRLGQEPVVPPDLLARIPQFESDPEVQFQLVRIRALEGNHAGAERILSSLEPSERYKAAALYSAVKGDWDGVLEATGEGLAAEPDLGKEYFLRVLRVGALLDIVTGGAHEVLIGGRPDLDHQDAKRLRDGTLKALRVAKDIGWPANSEMLLDGAAVACLIFGSDQELLDLISDFSNSRPHDYATRTTLARIATFEGDHKTVIEALKDLPTVAPSDSARLVISLSEDGEHHDAVSIAMEKLLLQPHSELIDFAVMAAAIAANKLGSISEEDALRKHVFEGSHAPKTLLEFFDNNRRTPEDRHAHIDKLWSEAMDGEGNEALQDNLFFHLRPDREADVDRIVILSERKKARRSLTAAESAKYAAALLYRKKYDKVLLFTERAANIFPYDEDIGLVRAIALDQKGQSAAAEMLLRQFTGSSRRDLLQTHSTMLLRVGEVETAINIVKKALANATSRSDRFHFQQSLTVLYRKLDPEQYIEAAWRLGQFADQSIESEEGAFLANFLLASFGPTPHIEDSRIGEFRGRVKQFSERFPASDYFRVGKMSEAADAPDVLAQLNAMLGIDEQTARHRQRLRNIGERSGSYIPLALRPKGIAPYVTNVMDLLRVSILGIHEGESSKIIVGDGSVGAPEFRASPILDLVTVAALVELDLFDKLFSLWTAIAVPKISLQTLSELSLGALSAGADHLVDKVAEAIRRHREEILQPGPQPESRESNVNSEHSVITDEVRGGRFEFLSLDIAAAFLVENETGLPGRCHSLWDLLSLAEQSGTVAAETSRSVRLRVASWNTTGAPVEVADIAAVAHSAVLDAASGRDNAAAARVARRYVTKIPNAGAIERAAEPILAIAMSDDGYRDAALEWFANVCFRELILARSANFAGSADALASYLLALLAVRAREHANALEHMRLAWRVIDTARTLFGGSRDRGVFLGSLGVFAANIFDQLAKRGGIASIGEEEACRELLFSGVTHGTQDRDVLQEAYFARTSELQQS